VLLQDHMVSEARGPQSRTLWQYFAHWIFVTSWCCGILISSSPLMVVPVTLCGLQYVSIMIQSAFYTVGLVHFCGVKQLQHKADLTFSYDRSRTCIASLVCFHDRCSGHYQYLGSFFHAVMAVKVHPQPFHQTVRWSLRWNSKRWIETQVTYWNVDEWKSTIWSSCWNMSILLLV
jgi:hypothetical protein